MVVVEDGVKYKVFGGIGAAKSTYYLAIKMNLNFSSWVLFSSGLRILMPKMRFKTES